MIVLVVFLYVFEQVYGFLWRGGTFVFVALLVDN